MSERSVEKKTRRIVSERSTCLKVPLRVQRPLFTNMHTQAWLASRKSCIDSTTMFGTGKGSCRLLDYCHQTVASGKHQRPHLPSLGVGFHQAIELHKSFCVEERLLRNHFGTFFGHVLFTQIRATLRNFRWQTAVQQVVFHNDPIERLICGFVKVHENHVCLLGSFGL